MNSYRCARDPPDAEHGLGLAIRVDSKPSTSLGTSHDFQVIGADHLRAVPGLQRHRRDITGLGDPIADE